MADRTRIVIVGGGFGGLYLAKALKGSGLDITVIDRRNFHVFQPLLYQVATGALSPGDIAIPLRVALRGRKDVRVWMAEAVDIDPASKSVRLADGAELPYDYLVVAAGARHSYFGHAEWERLAPGLKAIEDATEIRSRIFSAFEAAERESDPVLRREWLTFAIVGGGPTGVELAGTLGEIANDALRSDFRSIRPEESRILLLDGGPRLLAGFPEELSRRAERDLIHLGVRPLLKALVTDVEPGGVVFQREGRTERIHARTVIWAAGVQGESLGRTLAARTGVTPDRAGRIPVDQYLRVPGHPNIFVIGDLAAAGQNGKPLSGVAPVAMQQGRYVAKYLRSTIAGKATQPFVYRDPGNMATIGKARAVVDLRGFRFAGLFAWLFWLFVHLMYLAGFQNRVIVFIQWAFSYFTLSRRARLITNETVQQPQLRPAPDPRIERIEQP